MKGLEISEDCPWVVGCCSNSAMWRCGKWMGASGGTTFVTSTSSCVVLLPVMGVDGSLVLEVSSDLCLAYSCPRPA